jgi:hypothetical protein
MNSPFEVLLKPTAKDACYKHNLNLADCSWRYRIGKPERPDIKHDNGFLDKYPKREATIQDKASLAKWLTKLVGAEVLCTPSTGKYVEKCSHSDLSDATGAYRHFLESTGTPRQVDYEKFIREDPSGDHIIHHLRADFQKNIEIIGKDRVKFSVTSDIYTVGMTAWAPYPQTENWQKTLGGHVLWVSADIEVTVNKENKIEYSAKVTINMEDRYNFNPGGTDVKTKISDAENGKFELTGLGKQYLNYATIHREWTWVEGENPLKGWGPY